MTFNKMTIKKIIAWSKCAPVLIKGLFDLWNELSTIYNEESYKQLITTTEIIKEKK